MDNFLHAFWISGTNKEPQATVSPKALHFLLERVSKCLIRIIVKRIVV